MCTIGRTGPIWARLPLTYHAPKNASGSGRLRPTPVVRPARADDCFWSNSRRSAEGAILPMPFTAECRCRCRAVAFATLSFQIGDPVRPSSLSRRSQDDIGGLACHRRRKLISVNEGVSRSANRECLLSIAAWALNSHPKLVTGCGTYRFSIAVISAAVSLTASAATASSTWPGLAAPMIGAETPALASTQPSATCAIDTPRVLATFSTAPMTAASTPSVGTQSDLPNTSVSLRLVLSPAGRANRPRAISATPWSRHSGIISRSSSR